MRRRAVLIAVLTLLGAATAQFRLQLPAFALSFEYDPRALKLALSRLPSYSIAFEFDSKLLGPLLARLQSPRAPRLASVDPAPEPQSAPAMRANPAESPVAEEQPVRRAAEAEIAANERTATPAAPAEPQASDAASQLGPVPAERADGAVTLDFAKIAPEGTSVLAGRADPGTSVTVLDGDKPVGTATAGPDGEWSMATEHTFASPEPTAAPSSEVAAPAVTAPAAAEARVASQAPAATSKPDWPNSSRSETAKPDSVRQSGSPADRLVAELERTVEKAREEAKQRDAKAEPTKDEIPAKTAEVATPEPLRSMAGAAERDPVAAPPPVETSAATPLPAPAAAVAQLEPTPDQPAAIPVPVQFVYREARLTENGRQALSLLLEYLTLKKLDDVTLSGHADESGTAGFNMALSRERLMTIERLLRKGGYNGRLELLPRGEAEPFAGVDRARLSPDDLMQLDRRVELRVAR